MRNGRSMANHMRMRTCVCVRYIYMRMCVLYALGVSGSLWPVLRMFTQYAYGHVCVCVYPYARKKAFTVLLTRPQPPHTTRVATACMGVSCGPKHGSRRVAMAGGLCVCISGSCGRRVRFEGGRRQFRQDFGARRFNFQASGY